MTAPAKCHILFPAWQAQSASGRHDLKEALQNSGLELMDDKRAMLIERINNVIIEMVHYSDEMPRIN